MMNDDTLRNIEYLREKADVSYEEASNLLERYDGNVMRVLVELERQGRVYQQAAGPATGPKQTAQTDRDHARQHQQEAKEKVTDAINKAFSHRIVVEKRKDGHKETVVNLSAPFVAAGAIVAPHLAIASAALTFVMGYRVKWKKEKVTTKVPDDVESFVDQTVSNIKKTASSVADTVRGETVRKAEPSEDTLHHQDRHDDDNDEGGEITVD